MHSQKGFITPLIAVILLIAAGIGGYVLLQYRKTSGESIPTPTQNPYANTPSSPAPTPTPPPMQQTQSPVSPPLTPAQVKSSSTALISNPNRIQVFGPVPYYNNGIFGGNDPITFSWSADYLIASPTAYLSSKTYGNILVAKLQKMMRREADAGPIKFSGSIPPNQNIPTGNYKIIVCDERDVNDPDIFNNPHCGSSILFTITATTTPFQP